MTWLLPLLILAAPPAAPASAPARAPLDVTAASVELDPEARQVRFSGGVLARQGAVTLRCDRLSARLTDGGDLGDLRAEGGVRLAGEGWQAEAEAARYDRAQAVLVLTGQPTLRRGPHTLRGERVRVWPDTGRVVVDQPRGTLDAPALNLDRALAPLAQPRPAPAPR